MILYRSKINHKYWQHIYGKKNINVVFICRLLSKENFIMNKLMVNIWKVLTMIHQQKKMTQKMIGST